MAGPDAVAVRGALQHPGRCAVLQACLAGPLSARQVMERTGIASVTCYRHIHALVDARLLVVERQAMTPDGHPYDLYRSTVSWARLTVTDKGIQPDWRLRAGMGDRLHHLWRDLEDRQ